MFELKESLDKLQESLEVALQEVKNMSKYVNTLQKVVMGEGVAPAGTPKAKKRGSAGADILSLVQRSRKPISISNIKEKTEHSASAINAALNKLKKEGKIDSPQRGVYVAVKGKAKSKPKAPKEVKSPGAPEVKEPGGVEGEKVE